MQDTVTKGAGNSRTLASVPNLLTLYPTYEAFSQALIKGELPIDVGPINPAGVEVIGTALNKANLLSDSTENSIWGNADNRTVDAALAQLRTLTQTAQNAANTAQTMAKSRVLTQTGTIASSGDITIKFSISWDFVFVHGYTSSGASGWFMTRGFNYGFQASASGNRVSCTQTDTSITIHTVPSAGTTLYYIAFGRS